MSFISKHIFYPAWEIKDNSHRLRTLQELEQTQWLSERDLKEKQWQKLVKILHYAYSNCAYYKDRFDANGIDPLDIRNEVNFRKIPLLSKKDIRAHTDMMISGQYQQDALVTAKTGGSTGMSLKLYFDRRCQENRNAAAFRCDRWAGWDLGEMKAALWGNPPLHNRFKERVRNTLLDRTFYLDTMDLNQNSIREFVSQYRKHKPTTIFGHSHSIYMLAKFINKMGIEDLRPKGIISTSMMLIPHERAVIEQTFNCKVTDRYGCEEVGLIGCECEIHNGFHLNIDHLYIEFLKNDGTAASLGEAGSIIVTDLINHGMPLIRYKIEDVGVPNDRKCRCGRGLPLMEEVSGRVADSLIKKDGSLVAGVSLVERTLTAIEGIEQMQIVQEDTCRFTLNVVPDAQYNTRAASALQNEFLNVFGSDISTDINVVDKIPQESSGKYRFAICKININNNQSG